MALGIHGLLCSRCQKPIDAQGLSCAACSAPHHASCYSEVGHCASCLAAKEPRAFEVREVLARPLCYNPAGPLLGSLLGVMVVLILGVLSAGILPIGVHAHRAAGTMPACGFATCPRVCDHYGPPPAAPFLPMNPNPGGRRMRLIALQIVSHEGWLSASVEHPVVTDGLDEGIQFSLGQVAISDLYVNLEAFGVPESGPRPSLKIRVAQTTVNAAGQVIHLTGWIELGPVPLYSKVTAWRRIRSNVPFNQVQMEIDGSTAGVRVHGLIGLMDHATLAEPSIGERRVIVLPGPVKGKTDTFTVRTDDGVEATLPASVFSPSTPPIVALVSHPTIGLCVALGPGGDLDLFGQPGSPKGASHIFSLEPIKRMDAMRRLFGHGTGEWLDGVASATLLSRWQPAWPFDRIVDTRTNTVATLWDDGRIVLASAHGDQTVTLDGPGPLADLLGRRADSRPFGEMNLLESVEAMLATPSGIMESRAFLAQVKSAAERRMAVFPPAPIPGETLVFTWLPPSAIIDGARALTVVSADGNTVELRQGAGVVCSGLADLRIARGFLPAQPTPHLGLAGGIFRTSRTGESVIFTSASRGVASR